MSSPLLQLQRALRSSSLSTHTRPWGEFIERFDIPKDWPSYERRIYSNILYYKANYAFLSVLLFAYGLVANWTLLLSLCVIVAAWIYALVLAPPVMKVGKSVIRRQEKLLGLVAGSVLLLLVTGTFLPMLALLAIMVLLVILHASIRTPNMKANAVRIGTDIRMQIGAAMGGGTDAPKPDSPGVADALRGFFGNDAAGRHHKQDTLAPERSDGVADVEDVRSPNTVNRPIDMVGAPVDYAFPAAHESNVGGAMWSGSSGSPAAPGANFGLQQRRGHGTSSGLSSTFSPQAAAPASAYSGFAGGPVQPRAGPAAPSIHAAPAGVPGRSPAQAAAWHGRSE